MRERGGDGQPAGARRPAHRVRELAGFFLRLGAIAFGGPAAHIAMMNDEVVRKRGWLTREQFLDLLGAANLIPGPSSTEMAIYIGLVRAGWRGLIVAGTCFILPAMLIVLALAVAYVQYGTLPRVVWLLYGVKPAIRAGRGHLATGACGAGGWRHDRPGTGRHDPGLRFPRQLGLVGPRWGTGGVSLPGIALR